MKFGEIKQFWGFFYITRYVLNKTFTLQVVFICEKVIHWITNPSNLNPQRTLGVRNADLYRCKYHFKIYLQNGAILLSLYCLFIGHVE